MVYQLSVNYFVTNVVDTRTLVQCSYWPSAMLVPTSSSRYFYHVHCSYTCHYFIHVRYWYMWRLFVQVDCWHMWRLFVQVDCWHMSDYLFTWIVGTWTIICSRRLLAHERLFDHVDCWHMNDYLYTWIVGTWTTICLRGLLAHDRLFVDVDCWHMNDYLFTWIVGTWRIILSLMCFVCSTVLYRLQYYKQSTSKKTKCTVYTCN